jgi:hypothetical protein
VDREHRLVHVLRQKASTNVRAFRPLPAKRNACAGARGVGPVQSRRALACACSLLRVEWADFDFKAPRIAFVAFWRAVGFRPETAVATQPARFQPRRRGRFRATVDSRRFGRFRPIFPLIAIAERPRVRERACVRAGSLLAVASVRSFRATTRLRELVCAFWTRQSVQPAAEKFLQ